MMEPTFATIPSSSSPSSPSPPSSQQEQASITETTINTFDEISKSTESIYANAANIFETYSSSTKVTLKGATSALGSLLPSAASSLSNLTSRKNTLPDKTTASQVLMYRQLLHTECRPGLRLSRKFQGTAAQLAVMHMPWWEQGVEQTGRMVLSYDNLITRLWLHGAVLPYTDNGFLLSIDDISSSSIDTMLDSDSGLPPIPHEHWVNRLGFQQEDPVTDFRSGGVLSLAMLVHIVEACPHVLRRFITGGDAEMLPFGITTINVMDMLAKFLMFSKSVDKVDALMTSKPFWRAFSDPNALLVTQELSMDMLCDVVVELGTERRYEHPDNDTKHKVTVFDFSAIMGIIEKRIRVDLLGAGPRNVDDLRCIAARLRSKYSLALEKRIQAKQSSHLHGAGEGVFSFHKWNKHIPISTPTCPPDMSFAEDADNVTTATTTTTTTTTTSDFSTTPIYTSEPSPNSEKNDSMTASNNISIPDFLDDPLPATNR